MTEDLNDQPIAALLTQDRETAPDFVDRVRKKIYRRTASAQLMSFSWFVPKVFFVEMLELIGFMFSAIGGKKGA